MVELKMLNHENRKKKKKVMIRTYSILNIASISYSLLERS